VRFAFKDSQYVPARATKGKARGLHEGAFRADVDIEFIGVWDTVDVYGLPIDDERQTFHPVLWDATGTESRWIPPAPAGEATRGGGATAWSACSATGCTTGS